MHGSISPRRRGRDRRGEEREEREVKGDPKKKTRGQKEEDIPPRSWQFAKEIYLFPGAAINSAEKEEKEIGRSGIGEGWPGQLRRRTRSVGTHSHPRGVRFVRAQAGAGAVSNFDPLILPLRPRNASASLEEFDFDRLPLRPRSSIRRAFVRWPHSATLSPEYLIRGRAGDAAGISREFLKGRFVLRRRPLCGGGGGRNNGGMFLNCCCPCHAFCMRGSSAGRTAAASHRRPSPSSPSSTSPMSGIGD